MPTSDTHRSDAAPHGLMPEGRAMLPSPARTALREAAATRTAQPVEAAEAPALIYDPVLHVVVPAEADAGAIQKELGGLIRRDLQKNARRRLERR